MDLKVKKNMTFVNMSKKNHKIFYLARLLCIVSKVFFHIKYFVIWCWPRLISGLFFMSVSQTFLIITITYDVLHKPRLR